MNNNYFDITVPKNDSLAALVLSYKVLHGTISSNKDLNIGLGFPGFYHDKVVCTIGSAIRIFSDYSLLVDLQNHPHLIDIAQSGGLDISAIKLVPKDAVPVRFVRSRSPDYYRNNCQKYADFKGKAGPLKKLPYLSVTSSSSLNANGDPSSYSIYIRKEEAGEHVDGSYSAYGLSQNGSTVPWFAEGEC